MQFWWLCISNNPTTGYKNNVHNFHRCNNCGAYIYIYIYYDKLSFKHKYAQIMQSYYILVISNNLQIPNTLTLRFKNSVLNKTTFISIIKVRFTTSRMSFMYKSFPYDTGNYPNHVSSYNGFVWLQIKNRIDTLVEMNCRSVLDLLSATCQRIRYGMKNRLLFSPPLKHMHTIAKL